jgi:hypothetical protein
MLNKSQIILYSSTVPDTAFDYVLIELEIKSGSVSDTMYLMAFQNLKPSLITGQYDPNLVTKVNDLKNSDGKS